MQSSVIVLLHKNLSYVLIPIAISPRKNRIDVIKIHFRRLHARVAKIRRDSITRSIPRSPKHHVQNKALFSIECENKNRISGTHWAVNNALIRSQWSVAASFMFSKEQLWKEDERGWRAKIFVCERAFISSQLSTIWIFDVSCALEREIRSGK